MKLSDYVVSGRVVERTIRPRFRVPFVPAADDGWETGQIEWLDDPPTDIMAAARFMREAADAFRDARLRRG